MKRLTKGYEKHNNEFISYVADSSLYPNMMGYEYAQAEMDCINKLGKLEDLEEELRIDLITLFNVIKQDYIYYKHYSVWGNKFKINEEHITGLKCIDYNTIALWAKEYSGKEHIVYLKDYGTKWSLRKEDLQDEKEN